MSKRDFGDAELIGREKIGHIGRLAQAFEQDLLDRLADRTRAAFVEALDGVAEYDKDAVARAAAAAVAASALVFLKAAADHPARRRFADWLVESSASYRLPISLPAGRGLPDVDWLATLALVDASRVSWADVASAVSALDVEAFVRQFAEDDADSKDEDDGDPDSGSDDETEKEG